MLPSEAIASVTVRELYRKRFEPQACRAKAAVWRTIVRRYLQRWVHPQDAVLDLGCGYGEFLGNVRCARRIGVDLNPCIPEWLAPDIEFHKASVTRLDFLPADSVDVVFTSNVLEHLADKDEVQQTLSEGFRVLRPGGHLIAMGPNLRFLPGEYWDFWDHIVPITDRSLAEIMKCHGYTIVNCIPKFLPYTTKQAYPQSPLLVLLYLRCPIAWRIFGRQFLIRAQKDWRPGKPR